MERALLENDGIAIAKRIDQLNLAQNQVLKQQADVGNIVRELYSTQSRLENQQFEKERQLSDIQDLDVAEATVDLKVARLTTTFAEYRSPLDPTVTVGFSPLI